MAMAAALPEMSRREARRLIESHSVVLNGRPVGVASRMVGPEDHIHLVTEPLELTILKSSDGYLAVDKPPGIASQPMRDRSQLSLPSLLALQLRQAGENGEIYVVHRLDFETSGVILFGRDKKGAAMLSKLFAGGEVAKTYQAAVHGVISKEVVIETPVKRTSPSRFEADVRGRAATSRIIPLASVAGYTFVEIVIETGRTHQIRVHLASIGHPIAGDRKYGRNAGVHSSRPDSRSPRLLLHAARIEHPFLGEIAAPLPADFDEALARLGLSKASV